MKIVFFRHSLFSRGGDKMVVTYANYLAEKGHNVSIVAAVVDTVFHINSNIDLQQLASSSKISTVIKAIFTRFNADLVVADIIPMICFLLFRNRRLVYFAQDYDESYYSSTFLKKIVRFFYIVGLKYFRVPVVAVSIPLGDQLSARFKAVMHVVENGIDTSIFKRRPEPELVQEKAGRRSILLLARHDLRKGFDLALQTVKKLDETYTGELEIWTVGDHCQLPNTRMIHKSFGYVDEKALCKIMSSADVFLYPSRHEGFGLMPLEAMACGCPVVSSTALKVATHEINALLSPVGDVESLTKNVRMVLEEPDLAERLVTAGYSLVEGFSLEHSTSHFEKTLLCL